jgi:hypothetical protein
MPHATRDDVMLHRPVGERPALEPRWRCLAVGAALLLPPAMLCLLAIAGRDTLGIRVRVGFESWLLVASAALVLLAHGAALFAFLRESHSRAEGTLKNVGPE